MSEVITFHIPLVLPTVTSQSAGKRLKIKTTKKGKHYPKFFQTPAYLAFEVELIFRLKAYRPKLVIKGPVNLHIDFVWPFRKSEPAWRVALGRVPHTVKPDCSNMVKQTEDVMTKLDFWEDDGQVCNLSVSKAWGTHFGINVRIEELELPKRPKPPPKVKRDRKKKSPTQGTLL